MDARFSWRQEQDGIDSYHPSGDQYWVFEILDIATEEKTESIKAYVSEHGGMKMKPYILKM